MPRRSHHYGSTDDSSNSASSPTSSRDSPMSSIDPITSRESFVARLITNSQDNSELTRPRTTGIHHLKFAVSNLDVSIAWYERVLGAIRIAALDHHRPDGSRFAAVCEMPGWSGLFLELRHAEARAIKDRGWDPVTLMVDGYQDLLAWVAWLDRWRTTHSQLLTGPRGWILVFEDPDSRRIRIYTREQHGGTELPSRSNWLDEP